MRSVAIRSELSLLITLMAFTLSAAVDGEELSPPVFVFSQKGLEVASVGGAFKLRLGGRLQIDAAFHDRDTSVLDDGSEIRRARVYLKGSVFKNWNFKSQADFKGGEADIKDLYLRYSNGKETVFTVGNFKEPFSIEEQTSSKRITFMERALPVAAFSPGRAVGLAFHRGSKRGGATVGLFGEPISGSNNFTDQGFGIAARITRAPVIDRRKVFHLGIAGEYREPRQGERIRFDAAPESSVTGEDLVRTRRLDNVDAIMRYGFETAITAGSVSFQGEYILVDVNRDLGEPKSSLSGWYAYVSWFPTGESRPYKVTDGAFGQVHPRRKRGAWELALRFSSLDLDGVDADGGQEENVTLGLSCYASANLRFMANYVQVDSVRRGDRDAPGILQLRAQVAF